MRSGAAKKGKKKKNNGPISVAECVNSFGSLVFSNIKFHTEELSWCERLCSGSRGQKGSTEEPCVVAYCSR